MTGRPLTTSTSLDGLAGALVQGDAAAVALVAGDEPVTYAALRTLIRDRADQLGLGRRGIVLLTAEPSLEFVVTYLAVLHAGHVPLLAGAHVDRLRSAWNPGAFVSVEDDTVHVEHTGVTGPEIHPDLALLMSTSGSTGNPKLVRLSRANVASNATAIVDYLGLTPADRAITTLPLHYCYGLSVLHSHLRAGASIVLTAASVADPCFRDALVRHRVTSVSGVPHTFDLAERAGPDRLAASSLRFLTVAGGRMQPDTVVRWAERADRWGAELFVMYGQTEATARMAYLPPALARTHPSSIGRPIPGGELTVDAPDGEIGELVYRGPNVMMGYALTPTDLALDATITELHTGDLARRDPRSGLVEVVGRRSRFVKPFGLRIDLDGLESDLRSDLAIDVAVAGDDERLACVAPGACAHAVTRWLIDRTGIPEARIGVTTTVDIPRTASGKVDNAAVLSCVEPAGIPQAGSSVAGVYAAVLGRRTVADDDTFVSLGGDSLAYVECSIRLEQRLGHLPPDWHLMPVAQLDSTAEPGTGVRRRSWPAVDSTAVLRAVGICTVVATHMRIRHLPGGAHLLLAVCGYNLSRFMMPLADTGARWRAGMRTAARAAGPALVWMLFGMTILGSYGTRQMLFVNTYIGPEHHRGDDWHFWFVEVFAHLVLLTTALLAIPPVRRLERRHPYQFALAVLAATLVFRYGIVQIGTGLNLRFRTHGVAWFFAIGWLVHRSDTTRRKALTTVIVVAIVPGFFSLPQREWFIVAGIVGLVWFRQVRLPRPVVPVIAVVSSASLWILVTHFTFWPPLVDTLGRTAAYPATLAGGILVWMIARCSTTSATRWWHAAATVPGAVHRRRRPTRPVRPPQGAIGALPSAPAQR